MIEKLIQQAEEQRLALNNLFERPDGQWQANFRYLDGPGAPWAVAATAEDALRQALTMAVLDAPTPIAAAPKKLVIRRAQPGQGAEVRSQHLWKSVGGLNLSPAPRTRSRELVLPAPHSRGVRLDDKKGALRRLKWKGCRRASQR
jgi:hypothetical protein